MILILDTDVFIDWLEAGLSEAMKRSFEQSDMGVSTVTLMEVLEGVRPGDAVALDRFDTLVGQMSILPFDFETASIAARIRRDLRLGRKQIGHRALDIQIAATAIKHRAVLVTRNSRHFEDIEGLQLWTGDQSAA